MRRSLSSIGDVDLLGLGQHQDAGGAGVHPALRLGDRHPLHAVHAALELEQAVRRLARLGRPLGLHRDGDRLVAAEVGLGGVEDLDLPAAAARRTGCTCAAGRRRTAPTPRRPPPTSPRGSRPCRRPGRAGRGASAAAPRRRAGARRASRPRRRTPGPRRRARGPPRCRRRGRPSSFLAAEDPAQLGVALVELLGQPGVGVGLGRAELLLELGVLLRHRVDRLEHRSSSCLTPCAAGLKSRAPTHALEGTGRRVGEATGRRRPCRRPSSVGLLGVAGLEPGHAAAGVEDLLLARVERVALRADVGADACRSSRCCAW